MGSERHPFLVEALQLRKGRDKSRRHEKLVALLGTPGVAEQLLRIVLSGDLDHAREAAPLLRLVSAPAVRSVIVRRLAAAPDPERRLLLAEAAEFGELLDHVEAVESATAALDQRRRVVALVAGDPAYRDGDGRPEQYGPAQLAKWEKLRRASGTGVATAYESLLARRIRPELRAAIASLLGHQPGEHAALLLADEAARAHDSTHAALVRREAMRQASLPTPAPHGRFHAHLHLDAPEPLRFILQHALPDGPCVTLRVALASLDGPVTLDAEVHDTGPADPVDARAVPVTPGRLKSVLRRATRSGPPAPVAVWERLAGVLEDPFELPRPEGRVEAAALDALVMAGRVSVEVGLSPRRLPTLARLRTEKRGQLAARLRSAALRAVLVDDRALAARLLGEALHVAANRPSPVFAATLAFAAAPMVPPLRSRRTRG